MRPHPWIVRCLVAAALATLPVAAPSQPAPPPVTINSCQPKLDQHGDNTPSFLGIPVASTSSGIAIEFVNESNKVATLVNFDVDSNGSTFVIRDVGTFSPGVSIKHSYRNGSGQGFVLPAFIAPRITCRVASVKFEDGSIWRPGRPAQPPAPAAAGTRTPGTLASLPTKLDLEPGTESAVFLVQADQHLAVFKETDDCAGIASVYVASTGDTAVTYTVKPLAPGSCTATVTDEGGDSAKIPITVR
jgi:hypothetical protein